MTRVLLLCPDRAGRLMAGTAARYWEMARALSTRHEVTLAFAAPVEGLEPGRVRLTVLDDPELPGLAEQSTAVLIQGYVLRKLPWLKLVRVPLVVDLYDPAPLAELELVRPGESDRERTDRFELGLSFTLEQLLYGDFFLAAHERARDFWLGMLAALGRLSPSVRAGDPLLQRLLAIVPTGLPDEPPSPSGRAGSPAHPAFEPGRQVLLWNGGIWDWMDAPTLLTAFAGLLERHPGARLLFLGTGHPNPDVPSMGACSAARELAGRLGLLDRTVFFGGWVPYAERHRWLQAATLGVSLHREHLEARFAWRSRLLDNLWCGLPTVLSAGDALGTRMVEAEAAVPVPPGDAAAVEAALDGLLAQPDRLRQMRLRAGELAQTLRWSRVLGPFELFLAEPRMTRDRSSPPRYVDFLKEHLPHSPLHGAFRARLGRLLEREGLPGLLRRSFARLTGRRGSKRP